MAAQYNRPYTMTELGMNVEKLLPKTLSAMILEKIVTDRAEDYLRAMRNWENEFECNDLLAMVRGEDLAPAPPAVLAQGANAATTREYWIEYRDWQIRDELFKRKQKICLSKMKNASQGIPTLIASEINVTDAWRKLESTYVHGSTETYSQKLDEWQNNKFTRGISFEEWWSSFHYQVRLLNQLGARCRPQVIPQLTELQILENVKRNTPGPFDWVKIRSAERSNNRFTYQEFMDNVEMVGRSLDVKMRLGNEKGHITSDGKTKYHARVATTSPPDIKANKFENKNNFKKNKSKNKNEKSNIYGNHKGKAEDTYTQRDKKKRDRDRSPSSDNEWTVVKKKKDHERSSSSDKEKKKSYRNLKDKINREQKKYEGSSTGSDTSSDSGKIICWLCGREGHYKSNCPQASQLNNKNSSHEDGTHNKSKYHKKGKKITIYGPANYNSDLWKNGGELNPLPVDTLYDNQRDSELHECSMKCGKSNQKSPENDILYEINLNNENPLRNGEDVKSCVRNIDSNEPKFTELYQFSMKNHEINQKSHNYDQTNYFNSQSEVPLRNGGDPDLLHLFLDMKRPNLIEVNEFSMEYDKIKGKTLSDDPLCQINLHNGVLWNSDGDQDFWSRIMQDEESNSIELHQFGMNYHKIKSNKIIDDYSCPVSYKSYKEALMYGSPTKIGKAVMPRSERMVKNSEESVKGTFVELLECVSEVNSVRRSLETIKTKAKVSVNEPGARSSLGDKKKIVSRGINPVSTWSPRHYINNLKVPQRRGYYPDMTDDAKGKIINPCKFPY
jgi:hypothetical protein